MTRRFLALLFAATPLFGAYSYFRTDTFATISGYYWASNGSVSGGPTGLTSASPNGGSVIYWPNLDGTFDYEIKSTVTLSQYYGGYYYHLNYARAPGPRRAAEA